MDLDHDLYEASLAGDSQRVKLLLQNEGINVNYRNKDKDNQSALHVACEYCKPEHIVILSLLFDHDGLDINIIDELGNTPLHLACGNGHVEIAEVLIGGGADINIQNLGGETALHAAVSSNSFELVDVLVKAGVNLNLQSKFGETPLFIACSEGYSDIVRFLISHGADVDKPNSENETPLFAASQLGYIEVVKQLLNADCKLDTKNTGDKSAMDVAETEEIRALIRVSYYMSVNSADKLAQRKAHQAKKEHQKHTHKVAIEIDDGHHHNGHANGHTNGHVNGMKNDEDGHQNGHATHGSSHHHNEHSEQDPFSPNTTADLSSEDSGKKSPSQKEAIRRAGSNPPDAMNTCLCM